MNDNQLKRILIVDDNAMAIDAIKSNIDWPKLGCDLAGTFSNAPELLEQLGQLAPDLIISDIRMPGMTGLELAKSVLAINPAIKIILVSAYDDFDYARQAIRVGVFDYVEKPIHFDYLSQVIAKAVEKIDQERLLLAEFTRNRQAMEQKFYLDLLNYMPAEGEFALASTAEYLDVPIACPQYLCFIVRILNAQQRQSVFGIQHYHVQLLNLIADVNQLFADCRLLRQVTIANQVVFFLGHDLALSQSLYQLALYRLTDFFNNHQDSPLAFAIGIGNEVPSFWQLPLSFNDAKTAADYRFFFPERNVYSIRDLHPGTGSPLIFTDFAEEKMLSLLFNKNISGIEDFVRELENELAHSGLDRSGVFAFVYSIIAKLLQFFQKTGITAESVDTEIARTFANLATFSTTAEVCAWLGQILMMSCQILQDSLASSHQQVSQKALNYIETHYGEAALNLTQIAEHVNMSPSYLSEIFKKELQMTVSEAMTHVRIEAAKALLKSTNLPLKDISERVGYANQYYFSACFKKQTGQTPSSFR